MATVETPNVAAYSLVSQAAGTASSFINGQVSSARNVAMTAVGSFTTAIHSLNVASDSVSLLGITGIRIRRLNSSIASKLNEQVSWPILSSSTLSAISKPATLSLDSLPSFSSLVSGIDGARSQILTRMLALLADGATGLSTTVEQAS